MTRRLTFLAPPLLALGLVASAWAQDAEPTAAQPKLPTAKLTIISRNNVKHDFTVELAETDDQQQTGSNAKGGEESNSHNASFTLDVQFVRKLFTNQSSIEQLSDSRCFSCNSIGVRAVRQLWPYEFMATRFRANQQGKPFPASEHLTFPASADLPGCI